VHIPRESTMESHSMEWWTRPTKIGLWEVEDVLTVPVENSWDVRGHFSEPIMNFMMAHAHSVSFPYIMAGVWSRPPPVPTRFRMMWYDVVMSCIHPTLHDEWVGNQPKFHSLEMMKDEEFRLANKCVAIVSQWQRFPNVDNYAKVQMNMKGYLKQAQMLGSQYPVMIGLMILEKELQEVYKSYDNYLQDKMKVLLVLGDTRRTNPYPMADRYRRRCVAAVHMEVIRTIGNLVTRGVSKSGELMRTTLSKAILWKSSYLLITIWNNIGRLAYEIDPDFDLDLSATTLLLNTSNLARDGKSSQLKFFEGRTPTQVRMLALKKLSREWTLDHYELNRQVQGLNFTVADVYDNYLTSLQGISKELEVERFTQTTVMEMIACTDTFGPEEVDIPVSDANVERHLEFLCQRLGYASLVGSDLWTKDLPIGLWYESTKGLPYVSNNP